ncbi:MAG TPA: PaaI family thioesterase [Tepidisphaeraceae bacterium]|jgi:uncharacterized protein (TIGR00369 family)
MLLLPRTAGCLVCGRDNPIGFRVEHSVDASGVVRGTFAPAATHIGFHGVIHGGILATLLDEAMVWAATWSGLRFCLAAELNVRYRTAAAVGRPLAIAATVAVSRGRLITTTGTLHDGDTLVAEGTGKYIRIGDAENRAFVDTLVDDESTRIAGDRLRAAAR